MHEPSHSVLYHATYFLMSCTSFHMYLQWRLAASLTCIVVIPAVFTVHQLFLGASAVSRHVIVARTLRNTCVFTMRGGLLLKLALCGILVALAVSSIHLWLKKKSYLFSEEVISKLGKDALKKHGTDETVSFFSRIRLTVGRLSTPSN